METVISGRAADGGMDESLAAVCCYRMGGRDQNSLLRRKSATCIVLIPL